MSPRIGRPIIEALAGIALVASSCTSATEAPPPPSSPGMDVQEAYEVILTTDRFSGSHVGYSGATPNTVHAFRTLAQSPSGGQLFRQLLVAATLPGQLYALAGIYLDDDEAFRRAISPYLQKSELVDTLFGCIWDQQQVRELAQLIAQGELPRQLERDRHDGGP